MVKRSFPWATREAMFVFMLTDRDMFLAWRVANSVEILALRHVKQGMEAEGFRAVQSLVRPLHFSIGTSII